MLPDVGKASQASGAPTNLLCVNLHVTFQLAPTGEYFLTNLTLPGGQMAQQMLLKRGCEFAFIITADPDQGIKKLQQNPDYETRNATFCKKPYSVGDP